MADFLFHICLRRLDQMNKKNITQPSWSQKNLHIVIISLLMATGGYSGRDISLAYSYGYQLQHAPIYYKQYQFQMSSPGTHLAHPESSPRIATSESQRANIIQINPLPPIHPEFLQAKALFNTFLKDHYFILTFVFLFALSQVPPIRLPYHVSFAWLWIYDLYNIAISCKQSTTIPQQSPEQSNRILATKFKILLLETLFSIGFKIAALTLVEIQSQHFIYLTFPAAIMFLLRIRIYSLEKDEVECYSLISFSVIGLRIFLIIGLICICLKLDHYSTWTWKEVFWWYWVFLSICVGVTFAVVLMTVSKSIQIIVGDIEAKISEIKALLWCSLVCIGATITSCLWVTGSIELLENKDQQWVNLKFILLFCYLINHMLAFSLASYFWKDDIQDFFYQMIIDDDNIDALNENQLPIQTQPTQPDVIPAKVAKFHIPKILKRFSATYFGVANQTEQDEAIKKQKETIKKAKSTKQQLQSTKSKKKREKGSSTDLMKSRQRSGSQQGGLTNKTSIVSQLSQSRQQQLVSKHYSHISKNSQSDNDNNCQLQFNDEPNHPDMCKSEVIGNQLKVVQEEKSMVQLDQSENGIQHFKRVTGLDEGAGQHRRCNSDDVAKQPMSPSQSQVEMSQAQQGEQSVSQRVGQSNQNCLVCFDKMPDSVFMECGHGGLCYECSLDVWRTTNECYLCRNKIIQVLQIDLNSRQGCYMKVISSTQMVQD